MDYENKADELVNKGIEYANQGNWGKAISYYKKALSLKPKYPEAFYNIGTATNALGRTNEAVEAYKNSIRYLEKGLVRWVPYLRVATGVIVDNEGKLSEGDPINRLTNYLHKFVCEYNTPGGGRYSDLKDYIVCIFEVEKIGNQRAISALKKVYASPCLAEIALASQLALDKLGCI